MNGYTSGRKFLGQCAGLVAGGLVGARHVVAVDPALRHAERPQRRLRFNGLRVARNVPEFDLPDVRN